MASRAYSVCGGGPREVVSTAAFHARVRGSVPGLGGLKETKMFLPHPRVKVSIVGSLRDREVACSASDRQGSNFESCVWRTVAQFSLYVHKGGLKPDSFHTVYDKLQVRLLMQIASRCTTAYSPVACVAKYGPVGLACLSLEPISNSLAFRKNMVSFCSDMYKDDFYHLSWPPPD